MSTLYQTEIGILEYNLLHLKTVLQRCFKTNLETLLQVVFKISLANGPNQLYGLHIFLKRQNQV